MMSGFTINSPSCLSLYMFDKMSSEVLDDRKSFRLQTALLQLQVKMAGTHILIVVYQLWHTHMSVTSHHFYDVVDTSLLWYFTSLF